MVCEHNMDKFCQPKIIEIIYFTSFRKSNSKKHDAIYDLQQLTEYICFASSKADDEFM